MASTEKCKKKQRFVYSSIIITLHMPIRKSMLQTLVMHDGIGNETDAWSYAQMGPFFREPEVGFAVWEFRGPGSGVNDDRSTLGVSASSRLQILFSRSWRQTLITPANRPFVFPEASSLGCYRALPLIQAFSSALCFDRSTCNTYAL